MKISIINGSHRVLGQSRKLANYIEARLLAMDLCDEVYLLNMSDQPLPLWEEAIWAQDPVWKQRLAPISEQLKASDAFVVIAPEYHGMVPAAVKNFFLCFGRQELAHKPALIVAVSSVDGGAYPVAELRMSSYKNSRLCYMPEHLIIRNVESVLNDDGQQNNAETDQYFRRRIDWVLPQLQQYALALKMVRSSGVTDMSDFTNGM